MFTKTWVSFTELTDPTKHQEYNECHQLDHLPENRTLPGVLHGERWARTPRCAAASEVPEASMAAVHYMTTYFFRDSSAATRLDFLSLGTRATHWGRHPYIGWTRRPLGGYFNPIQGYVDPAALVSAGALPVRPARGVFLWVTELVDDAPAVEEVARWYDRVHIPRVVAMDGVAGAWTMVDERACPGAMPAATSTMPSARRHAQAPPFNNVRLTYYFLEKDPVAFADEHRQALARWEAEGSWTDTSRAERLLFAGPFEVIQPWQWDWFDELGA